ncbi:ribonuclease H protein [Pyrus ussuriensis x Pyrus communis]|uniref:Ribonuclease H protein n=1 Tax=Pyrus ussuriensis x Pyrus communis TaxID=2448454 RepID=A0A5N5HN14_9ROSA|nr:ribonuclease H protein [Pyrus ussuriensis x Pyrus communis]
MLKEEVMLLGCGLACWWAEPETIWDVHVWVDKWIPSLPVGHPVPRGEVAMLRNTRVELLMCTNNKSWDIDFLMAFLSTKEMNVIQDTVIGDTSKMDRLLNIPPKLRYFKWKTLHRALPTMADRFRRNSSHSPICPICHSDEETIKHILLQCPWVGAIWFEGALSYRVDKEAHIIFAISNVVGAFLEAKRLGGVMLAVTFVVGRKETRWSPPTSPFLKTNVDASWVVSNGLGFVGLIARDDEGKFLAARRQAIVARCAGQAKALALLYGCELGISQGYNRVSNSLKSISCLNDLLKNGSWRLQISSLPKIKNKKITTYKA